MKKVIVTGGHMTPALSVMELMKHRGWTIYYVGRIHALEGDRAPSQELREVRNFGYEFVPITTGRIQRNTSIKSFVSLIKIPWGFINALVILIRIRPDVVLSFGGYVAVPVTFIGKLLGIPIVTLEQTLSVGIANRVISKIADKVCIGWKEARRYFPEGNLEYTGNPLRHSIFVKGKNPIGPITKPLLYVTGGNLGAHSINVVFEEILEELLQKFTVIHQCGNTQEFSDFRLLSERKLKLKPELSKRYFPLEYIDQGRIGWVLNNAQIMVSRAGANIVTEVIALKIPTLFIPLPWSGEGEQELQAKYLVFRKAARMINQSDLTGSRLHQEILLTWSERTQIKENLVKLQHLIVPDAAKRLAHVVESVV